MRTANFRKELLILIPAPRKDLRTMDFMKEIKNTLDNEKILTEKGAVSYRTTGKNLLDLNFAVASLRRASEPEIVERFIQAFFEDKELAVKWLFFARDIREGLGERRLFRVCFKALADIDESAAIKLVPYVSEYGRWDDVFSILTDENSEINKVVYRLLVKQLASDQRNMRANKPISLLAKWMPSVNASSEKTKALAKRFCRDWGMSQREYRRSLSAIRKYLDIVERKMCANEWDKIDYSTVPSKANLIYKEAFMNHDKKRRIEYFEKLERGETKINSSVAFPHDIVNKYMANCCYVKKKSDATLEGMWKSLPDLVSKNNNTLVVADGSGSMSCNVEPRSNVTALDVANSLAIYFAERSSGAFKDKYITFSENPQLVDLSKGANLREKLTIARTYDECANTNIEKTFRLILQTAIDSNAKQEDLPANILVISDMEFDISTRFYFQNEEKQWICVTPDETLFEGIEKEFNEAGYKMPRLVFWNVCSRTGAIPVTQNELGVALVSGFSVNIIKMVMSGELDPYEVLVEQLMSPRYECITLK